MLPTGRNVKIILCPKKGQVKQRLYGFKHAKGEFVLQSDDDVIYDQNCLELLVTESKKISKNNSLAPAYYLIESKRYAYRKPNMRDRLLAWIANGSLGFQSGKISKSGISFGFADAVNYNEPVSADWLAGGCVLHRKENLILDNYFPFEGKAYSEDLFHCLELQRRGISLFIVPKAKAYFEWDEQPLDLLSKIKTAYRSFQVSLYYTRIANKSKLRLISYFIVSAFTSPLKVFLK